jgi:CBS domain-containing protein
MPGSVVLALFQELDRALSVEVQKGMMEETMHISDVMSKSVDLSTPDMKLREAALKMREDNVGALPVGENDRLIGMVTDRDIAVRGAVGDRPLDSVNVREVMSEKIYYCFEDEDLARAAELMAEHQVQRLPVLNRDKRLVGIIALADLARSGSEGEAAATKALVGISQPTGVPRQ